MNLALDNEISKILVFQKREDRQRNDKWKSTDLSILRVLIVL
jgi:hypothetical protein